MAANWTSRLATSALAFRGYNVANLGRSRELLEHAAYGPFYEKYLAEASRVCEQATGRTVDLAAQVRRGEETRVEQFAEAVSLIMGVEMAQVAILREVFDVSLADAKLAFGYSLGEIAAVSAAGMFPWTEMLRVPVMMADDCAALADDATLGVLFSRSRTLPHQTVQRICQEISQQGQGTVGVSAVLTPNSLIVIGQGDTLDRLRDCVVQELPDHVHLRKQKDKFPPMHTPIVWQRNICDRAALLMQSMRCGAEQPSPPVFSLVSGKADYTAANARQRLRDWVDHPQRLWDAILETLASGVETVIHFGPAPNIIPATYNRLADNIAGMISENLGMRALASIMIRHRWLQGVLPQRTALLRAPYIKHVILEDWLLEERL